MVPLGTACCIVELLSLSSSTLKEVPQECIWLGSSPVITLGKGTHQNERTENVRSGDITCKNGEDSVIFGIKFDLWEVHVWKKEKNIHIYYRQTGFV